MHLSLNDIYIYTNTANITLLFSIRITIISYLLFPYFPYIVLNSHLYWIFQWITSTNECNIWLLLVSNHAIDINSSYVLGLVARNMSFGTTVRRTCGWTGWRSGVNCHYNLTRYNCIGFVVTLPLMTLTAGHLLLSTLIY